MGAPAISEGEFIELYEALGPREMERRTGIAITNICQRRQRIERKTGIEIKAPNEPAASGREKIPVPQGSHRIELSVKDGHVIVFSDAHYWPPHVTLMHRAL